VLERLTQGASNKLIGRQLKLRESTVKVHIRHIMKKLGATNRTQAALCAMHLAVSTSDPERMIGTDSSKVQPNP
jgi:DNA-binding NarL/FixJ family response regulator